MASSGGLNDMSAMSSALTTGEQSNEDYPILQPMPNAGYKTSSLSIQTNYFEMIKFPEVLYRYSVTVSIGEGEEEKRITNRHILREVMANILQDQPADLFDNSDTEYATDYFAYIVSPKPLADGSLAVGQIMTTTSRYESVPPGNPTRPTVTITRLADQETSTLSAWQPGKAFVDAGDVLTPLNIMTQFPVMRDRQNWVNPTKNKFFETATTSQIPIRPTTGNGPSGLHLRQGFYVSVRPAQNDRILLNINTATSAFYDSVIVADFASQYRCSSAGQLAALLRGLRLRHIVLPADPKKNEKSRTLQNADEYMRLGAPYRMSEVHEVPGAQQLTGSYKVNVGSRRNPNMIPADQLWIEPDQPVRGLLDPKLSNNMIFVARKNPQQNLDLITEAFRPALNNPIGGIQIANSLLTLPAKGLNPPRVTYNNALSNTSVAKGSWDLRGQKLVSKSKFGVPVFLYRQGAFRNEKQVQDLRRSCQKLIELVNNTCKPGYHAASTTVEAVQDFEELHLESWKKDRKPNHRHVFVILDKDRYSSYYMAEIKTFFERLAGMGTTCIQHESLLKKLNLAFGANIGLKVNLQYGETNQTVVLSIPANTMVVGADVTHPGADSVAGAPSVAAVVASTDAKFSHYPGSARLQLSKQEIIDDLEGMMSERLEAYRDANKRLPDNILFYRDGVFEGQFAQVKTKEVPQIEKACEKLGKKINITFVITSKRHHTRFYLNKSTAKLYIDDKGNFLPGLVVDGVVTCPGGNDYYIQSHKPLLGTARPCHFFLITNGMKLNTFQLHKISYELCFLYARSTTSVSYPAPAYYADRLCDRARCWMHALYDKNSPRYRDRIKPQLTKYLGTNMPDTRGMTQRQKQSTEAGVVLNAIRNHYWVSVHSSNSRNPWHRNFDRVMFYL